MTPFNIVETIFDEGRCPDDCPYLSRDFETYPQGEREVREKTVECDLLRTNGDCTLCPLHETFKRKFDDDEVPDDEELEVELCPDCECDPCECDDDD